VIFIENATTDDARKLGKLMGANGYSGTFHDGDFAYHMRRYKDLKMAYRQLCETVKGGDADAEKDAGAMDTAPL
jgi:hypothetical protein